MKTIVSFILVAAAFNGYAQSIIGDWQLVKQSTCMEENMKPVADSTQRLIDDMKSRASATPMIISFKEKSMAEESTRIINSKKSGYSKNFMYKFDGDMLMVLDKKSRTITDNYIVETFSQDSLIISHASRPCETKVFVRIK